MTGSQQISTYPPYDQRKSAAQGAIKTPAIITTEQDL
jgi:hypothetical protein